MQWENRVVSSGQPGNFRFVLFLRKQSRDLKYVSLSFPGGNRSWTSSPLPSLLLQTPLLPSLVHSGPGLGCSGDKDVLSCFLGEVHPSCTLPYSRAWVVLGKGTCNHLSPTLHAEETKAPRGEVAFPSQFTCQDRTHDDSKPRVQPTRP